MPNNLMNKKPVITKITPALLVKKNVAPKISLSKQARLDEEKEEGRQKPRVIEHKLPPVSQTSQRKLDDDRNAKRIISGLELDILKYMDRELKSDADKENLEVSEISSGTSVRDTDDILRALYTLEGKHLVEPCPPGDFTSSFWKVTPIGERAVMMFKE